MKSDFMFQLTKEEWENLTFQNGISSKQHGGRRTLPYVFTDIALNNLIEQPQPVKRIGFNAE